MKTIRRLTLLIGLLIYVVLIPLAFLNGTVGFIADVLIFMGLTVFFYWNFDVFRLNVPIFILLILGMLSHLCGIFGWYHISPLPIQWDHVTHFFGLLPFSMMFFNFFSQWFTEKVFTMRNLLLVCAVVLAAYGVGAFIELSEFLGYLKFGFGEGAFQFGQGDGFETFVGNTSDVIADIGGGWINTGWDLIYNFAGIIFGLFVSLILKIVDFRKKLVH